MIKSQSGAPVGGLREKEDGRLQPQETQEENCLRKPSQQRLDLGRPVSGAVRNERLLFQPLSVLFVLQPG